MYIPSGYGPSMAGSQAQLELFRRDENTAKPTDPHGLVLEGWAQGYMVGSLIVIACITVSNMRKGVLLHKLILLELILGIWHGFWILLDPPVYAWWLSISAIPLNCSWVLHNVIAWIKIKPFLSKWPSRIFIGTIIMTIPYWVVEIYANFAFFHNVNTVFLRTRPFEALCRDPWWILMTVLLIYNIKVKYELRLLEVIRISPRFAVMLGAMFVSICFIVVDLCAVTDAFRSTLPVGINPFWKLAFVFKCLTDAVILDDFKTALDRLSNFRLKSTAGGFGLHAKDLGCDSQLNEQWDQAHRDRFVPQPGGAAISQAEQLRQLQLYNPAAYSELATPAHRNMLSEKTGHDLTHHSIIEHQADLASAGIEKGDAVAFDQHHHRNQSSRAGMLAGSDTDTECDSVDHSRETGVEPTQVAPVLANTFGLRIDQVIPDLPIESPDVGSNSHGRSSQGLRMPRVPSTTQSQPQPSHSPTSPISPSFHMPDIRMPGPSRKTGLWQPPSGRTD